MIAPQLSSSPSRNELGWLVLRLALSGLIAVHGWTRWLTGGVPIFGEWLTSQGLPFGYAIAASVTGIEILGTVLLATGKIVAPLTLTFAAIYSVGIYMVHAQEGWFVVGKGRNGVEYSVLLIVALLCLGLQHLPRKTAN
ncbi:DoxX family protein [Lysobacter sp. CFH 32150]|uniref:DoxX family protein n=1 Tax=Lysobacter sp. CFH 32150 TaxID=2927128 RepID=UPI001FA72FCF|nr:DoxX family protein [Lysobacter sp. CFH 32150]MCI4566887.1 DoxX family protein [Lysobacter sp. CFH 32150]